MKWLQYGESEQKKTSTLQQVILLLPFILTVHYLKIKSTTLEIH